MQQDIPSFDTLLRLAQQDPKKLEELRIKLARHTIDQAPERMQPRLRGLQFQIDLKRKLAKTPMAACIQLSSMMHRSLAELCDAINRPVIPTADQHTQEMATAKVLTFPTR